MPNPTYYDCVLELWTGTTTSTITLSGTAVSGPPGAWRTFTGASVTNGATVHVRIENQTATEWQVAEYTYDSGAGTLTYVSLYASSTGSQVTFTVGTKHLGIVLASTAANRIYTAAQTTDPLSQFASTTSAQLRGVLSDETGTGAAVFATSPTLVTPALGTPASGVLTNCTGTASGLTAGSVTTNANLTGPITSTGNATSIASQTGTGTKFVVDTSPTLVTPVLGVATATSVTAANFYGSASSAGAANYASTSHGTKGKATVGTALTIDEANLRVGIGNTSPAHDLDIVRSSTVTSGTKYAESIACTVNPGSASTSTEASLSLQTTYTASQNNTGIIYGAVMAVSNTGTGTVSEMRGLFTNVVMGNASGTITNGRAYQAQTQCNSGTITTGMGVYGSLYSTGGTITTGYAGYFDCQQLTGTLTTGYGIYVNASGAATNYGVYVAGGGCTVAAGGIVAGAPTGGNLGTGTINVATSISKNNTAYTNPDYVFEHFFTGKIEKYADREGAQFYAGLQPLEQVEDFARQHLHLPNIPDIPTGIFERADLVLELVESLYLYAFEANKRIKALEAKINGTN